MELLPITLIDVIAHSMGGLLVRSYLSGLNTVTDKPVPPIQPGIRKLALIGTPNFGTPWADLVSLYSRADMAPASKLLWDLNTWNQDLDDLGGIDTIAIAKALAQRL